jgi:hypothetical protein
MIKRLGSGWPRNVCLAIALLLSIAVTGGLGWQRAQYALLWVAVLLTLIGWTGALLYACAAAARAIAGWMRGSRQAGPFGRAWRLLCLAWAGLFLALCSWGMRGWEAGGGDTALLLLIAAAPWLIGRLLGRVLRLVVSGA